MVHTQIAKYHEAVTMATEAIFFNALWGSAHATNVSAEICKCGSLQITWPRLECWRGDEGMGFGRKSVSATSRQWLGRRHFRCAKMQRGSLEDAAPLFLRCVLCSLTLIRCWHCDGEFWYHPETWLIRFTPRGLVDRPQGGAKGEWLKKACFGSLFGKMSLETPPNLPAKTMDLCGELRRIKWKWQRSNLDREWMGSQNVAVERILNRGILGDIRGWQTLSDEKWVGSKFATCMWIYTKMVLTEWRTPTPEVQEYLNGGCYLLCCAWTG